MAEIIYTGKGYQAPETRNYALQALSMFGQQEQARKTWELERAYKDRDMFAKMLELDPVYASSKAAQKKIADIYDGYISKMTILNKNRIGPMSTGDLVEMQQLRGEAMAEMNYYKAASDQITNAARIYNDNPGAYNGELWNEYLREWMQEGTIPQGPPLLPAIQSLDTIFSSNRERQQALGTEWRQENGEKVAYKVPVDSADVNDEERMKRAVLAYRNNEIISPGQKGGLAYHVHGVYDNFGSETKRGYEMMAEQLGLQSGPEAYVASRAVGALWRDQQKQPWRVASKVRTPAIGESIIFDKSGGLWDGKNKISDIQSNIPVIDGKLDKAIVFIRPYAKKNPIPIPSELLSKIDGIETKGASVDAMVHVADNNKTYVIIDKGSLEKVRFSKNLVDALGAESFEMAEDGMYKLTDKAADDEMIPIPTNDVRGLIDSWTGGKFSDQLRMLPPARAAKTDLLGL